MHLLKNLHNLYLTIEKQDVCEQSWHKKVSKKFHWEYHYHAFSICKCFILFANPLEYAQKLMEVELYRFNNCLFVHL